MSKQGIKKEAPKTGDKKEAPKTEFLTIDGNVVVWKSTTQITGCGVVSGKVKKADWEIFKSLVPKETDTLDWIISDEAFKKNEAAAKKSIKDRNNL